MRRMIDINKSGTRTRMATNLRATRPILLFMFLASTQTLYQQHSLANRTSSVHIKPSIEPSNSNGRHARNDQLAQEQRLAIQIITSDPKEVVSGLATDASDIDVLQRSDHSNGDNTDVKQFYSHSHLDDGNRKPTMSENIIINLNSINNSDSKELGTKLTIGFLPIKSEYSELKSGQKQLTNMSEGYDSSAVGWINRISSAEQVPKLDKSASGVSKSQKEIKRDENLLTIKADGTAKERHAQIHTITLNTGSRGSKMKEATVQGVEHKDGKPIIVMNDHSKMLETGMEDSEKTVRPQLRFMVDSKAVDSMQHGPAENGKSEGEVGSSGTNVQQVTRPLKPQMQSSVSPSGDVSLQEAIEDLSSEIDLIAKHLEDLHEDQSQAYTTAGALEHQDEAQQQQAPDNNNDQRSNLQPASSNSSEESEEKGSIGSLTNPATDTREFSDSSAVDVGRESYGVSEANDDDSSFNREDKRRGRVIVVRDGSSFDHNTLRTVAPEVVGSEDHRHGGPTSENLNGSDKLKDGTGENHDARGDKRQLVHSDSGFASEQMGNSNNYSDDSDNNNQDYLDKQSFAATGISNADASATDSLSSESSSPSLEGGFEGRKDESMNSPTNVLVWNNHGGRSTDRAEHEQRASRLLLVEANHPNLFKEQIPAQATNVVENTPVDNNDDGNSSDMSASDVSNEIDPDVANTSKAINAVVGDWSRSESGADSVTISKKSTKQKQRTKLQQQTLLQQRHQGTKKSVPNQQYKSPSLRQQQTTGDKPKMDRRMAHMLERLKLYFTRDQLVKVVKDLENSDPKQITSKGGDDRSGADRTIDISGRGDDEFLLKNSGMKVTSSKRRFTPIESRLPTLNSEFYHGHPDVREVFPVAPPVGQLYDFAGGNESMDRASSGSVESTVYLPLSTSLVMSTKIPKLELRDDVIHRPVSKNQILESMLVSASNTDGARVAHGLRILREFRQRRLGVDLKNYTPVKNDVTH